VHHYRAVLHVLNQSGGHRNVLMDRDTYEGPTSTYMVTELIEENLRFFLSCRTEGLAIWEFRHLIEQISSGMVVCGLRVTMDSPVTATLTSLSTNITSFIET